ncbi:MAG: HAMP domain-containing protein [Thermoleophilia bacterium]
MRRRAEGISGGDAGERLPVPPARDELRRLGQTLNAMLGRVDAAMERERGFVADAAHELRTHSRSPRPSSSWPFAESAPRRSSGRPSPRPERRPTVSRGWRRIC